METPLKNPKLIFVFGSNLAGRHGKGAAKFAKENYGAIYGVGIGRTGNSYAIPTKDENLRVLSLDVIQRFVKDFIKYAALAEHELFYVTSFGTGLSGYSISDIKPLFGDFSKLPYNIVFTKDWFSNG